MRGNERVWTVARQTLAVVREKHVTANAAGLAYYAFNSLVPLSVLLYAALTTFGTGDVVAHGLELVTGVAAADLAATVDRVSGDGGGRVRAVILALAITVWSAHRLFRGVDSLFDAVYGVRRERSRVRRFLDSTLVLATVTAGVGVVAGVGVALSLRVSGPVWLVLGPVVLWLSLASLFAPMYVVLSGPDVAVREVLPGTALAASVWTVSLGGFRLSLGTSETVELYGLAGAVMLLLTWLYVGSFAVLVGVVLNAVVADRIEAEPEWLPTR